MSIRDMITASVRCTLCGAKGVGTCDCWATCPRCGCMYERGKDCDRCAAEASGKPHTPRVVASTRSRRRSKGQSARSRLEELGGTPPSRAAQDATLAENLDAVERDR